MQTKTPINLPVLVACLLGVASVGYVLSRGLPVEGSLGKVSAPLKTPSLNAILPEPSTDFTQVARGASYLEHTSSRFPIRLMIPKIEVDAPFVYVGLTPKGEMDVPKDPAEVAWYNLGVRPGDIGSAVISGHYGWKNNLPAVFDRLHLLRKGDKIFVFDERGATTTFVVRELRRYGEKDDASAVFISRDGKAHLNLITCEGIWNKTNKSYSRRLVVFTDKE